MDSARQAALRAYEYGRARHAVQRATLVLPAGVAAYWLGAAVGTAIATSVLLFMFAAVGGWWRSELGRGALAGTGTLLIPTCLACFLRTAGSSLPPGTCNIVCFYGAGLLGGVAGYMLGWSAGLRLRDQGGWFGAAALVSAAFSMAIGCTALGFGSLFGLSAGLLLVGVPTFVHARATA